MSEKWKPKKGEKYWLINIDGSVFSTIYSNDNADVRIIKFCNIFKTKEEAEAAVEKVKALLLSLQDPVTDCNQLPKLTAEIFDRPDCPEWAKYAAVCADGSVRVFLNKPIWQYRMYWYDTGSWWEQKLNGEKYDASYWQKSLIERPEKKQAGSDFVEKIKKSGLIEKARSEVAKKSYKELSNARPLWTFTRDQKMNYINGLKNKKSELDVSPEWCKVGEWVYSPCCCDPDKGTYFKVTQIDEVCIIGENNVCHVDNAVRARLRPYNSEELKALVGKVLECPMGNYLVTFFALKLNQIKVAESFIAADGLTENWTHLDGKPCGVLEHLNENGEWVE